MITTRRLGHVALAVRDLRIAVDFYCETFDMVVSDTAEMPAHPDAARGAWLRCAGERDHHCLALFELKRTPERVEGMRYGLHHLAFELGSHEELVGACRTLRERRVPIVGQRQYGPGCQVRLYCEDPDGNRVELYWDLDSVGWDGTTRPFRPLEEIDLERHDLESYLEYKTGTRDAARSALAAIEVGG